VDFSLPHRSRPSLHRLHRSERCLPRSGRQLSIHSRAALPPPWPHPPRSDDNRWPDPFMPTAAHMPLVDVRAHERGVRGLRAPVLRGLRLPLLQLHHRLCSRWRYELNCLSAPAGRFVPVSFFSRWLLVSSNAVKSPQRRRSRGSPRYSPACRKLNHW
jgi:hypothetical protein